MVGPIVILVAMAGRRGFPTDLPMVGQVEWAQWLVERRGFPTDLPMVRPLNNHE